jgi:hypothetical protein
VEYTGVHWTPIEHYRSDSGLQWSPPESGGVQWSLENSSELYHMFYGSDSYISNLCIVGLRNMKSKIMVAERIEPEA